MEKNQNEVIRISKTKLKKIMVASALAGTIFTTAVVGVVGVAKGAYRRYQGASYIVSQVEASGVLPDGLSSKEYENGIYFNYRDANGNAQIAKDSDALVADIIDDGLGSGFTAAQMDIYFALAHGYDTISDVSYKEIIEAKEDAYLEAIRENSKGASR